MKIVVDTNVLISGLLNPNGSPAMVLNLIVNDKVTLLMDSRIYSEYSEVLRRPKFNFKDEWINPLLDFIRMEGEFILPEPCSIELLDSDDIVFYEIAKSGKATYLVTGNTKHFPKDKIIKTPKEFLEEYSLTNI